MVSGGNMDVDFAFKDPQGNVLHSGNRVADSLFELLVTEPGVYEFCFGNSFSRMTDKEVFLLIMVDR